MKFLQDYTGEELELITDDAVAKLVSLECAEQGRPLLPPYPEKPVKPDYKADITLYKVGGSYGWYAETLEDAAKILSVISSVNIWNTEYSGSNYDFKKAVRKDTCSWDDPSKVEAEKAFSPELWDKVSNELEAYSKNKKLYDSELEEYRKAEKERTEISDWIWKHVNNAKNFKRKRDNFKSNLDDYIKLADGDEEAGRKFFNKSCPDANEYIGKFYNHSDLKQEV